MDKQEYNRTFELHSERVRSIVGKIPSVLIRYGIVIIFVVLLIMVSMLSLLPYKRDIQGKAYVYDISEVMADSIIVSVELEIPKMKSTASLLHKTIKLSTFEFNCSGTITEFIPYKTIKGRNIATLKLPNKQFDIIKQSQVDYTLTVYKTSVLNKILNSLGVGV